MIAGLMACARSLALIDDELVSAALSIDPSFLGAWRHKRFRFVICIQLQRAWSACFTSAENIHKTLKNDDHSLLN
jgi:hypothetical protein